MGSSGLTVGRIFGIRITIDWSWIFIFVLVAWNVGASMARIKQDGTALEITAVRRFAAREPQEMLGLYTKRSILLYVKEQKRGAER